MDGTIWKLATSSKKNTGRATRKIDDLVLLLGAEDVKASKQVYVEFASDDADPVKLALYKRRGLAKDVGVPDYGSGSHRIVLGGTTGPSPTRTGSPGSPRR